MPSSDRNLARRRSPAPGLSLNVATTYGSPMIPDGGANMREVMAAYVAAAPVPIALRPAA